MLIKTIRLLVLLPLVGCLDIHYRESIDIVKRQKGLIEQCMKVVDPIAQKNCFEIARSTIKPCLKSPEALKIAR
jgi:hypothetical protein